MNRLLIIFAAIVVITIISIFGVGYYGFKKLFPVFSQPNEIQLGQYYRMKVSLTHKPDNKPYEIDVGIGCGSRYQQALGESATSLSIRVPGLYGVALETGEGVVVQTPDICGKDPKKVIPDNFLPLMLYAPDANDFEFMIGYFSELAYEQKFSKLLFHSASVEKINQEEYEDWKETASANIVRMWPTAENPEANWVLSNHIPNDDVRHKVDTIACHSLIRIPIPHEMKVEVDEWRPEGDSRFWVLEGQEKRKKLSAAFFDILNKAQNSQEGRVYWGRDNDGAQTDGRGTGIYRRSGGGGIDISEYDYPNSSKYFGEAIRMPIRTNSGYKWLSDEIKSKKFYPMQVAQDWQNKIPATDIYIPLPKKFEYHISTKDGADKGFAYCYREMSFRFLDTSLPTRNKKLARENMQAVPYNTYIDDQLVVQGSSRWRYSIDTYLIERNEFFFYYSKTILMGGKMRQDVK